MELFRGGLFAITTGDITKHAVDAIVNSTNPTFTRSFGVDSAIHEAAGPKLAAACAKLGTAAFGEARITEGFDLPAKHVVHVVAPVWHDGTKGELELLAKAYRSALTVARDNGVKTIAFPAISTGTYAYPFEQATEVAIKTCAAFVAEDADAFERIIFCPFTAVDTTVYMKVATAHLG